MSYELLFLFTLDRLLFLLILKLHLLLNNRLFNWSNDNTLLEVCLKLLHEWFRFEKLRLLANHICDFFMSIWFEPIASTIYLVELSQVNWFGEQYNFACKVKVDTNAVVDSTEYDCLRIVRFANLINEVKLHHLFIIIFAFDKEVMALLLFFFFQLFEKQFAH